LLYDPVDLNKFKPLGKNTQLMNKYNIPNNKFIILTVGRLDRFKGHKLVINALNYLPDDIIYLIVGGGKEEKILKDLVKENKVERRVIFTGRVPESELVDFYNICDVFVLISKFDKNEGEGLPLTPIEAAACENLLLWVMRMVVRKHV
jgi:glycosyltransferase involved in cell wall biosynthesis